MNSMLKDALMVTLVAATLIPTPAQATLQVEVSAVATTSLGDVVTAYCDVCDAIGEAAKQGAIIVGKGASTVGNAVLATTPRDVYRFATHPDTLAVAGVAAAGYAIYKYMQNMPVTHYCSTCSTQWDGPAEEACPSCTKWHELQQVRALQGLEGVLTETNCLLDETNAELVKLQVAVDGLSAAPTVS